KTMLDAGATQVFAGDPQTWKRSAAFDALCADDRVSPQPLDVTDTDSVLNASRSIGGKVDILINTAEHARGGGVLINHDLGRARDTLDINCLGLIRLAQHFGPAMAGRAADGLNSAVAWVNLLSIYAHKNLPSRGVWAASQAGALSLSEC